MLRVLFTPQATAEEVERLLTWITQDPGLWARQVAGAAPPVVQIGGRLSIRDGVEDEGVTILYQQLKTSAGVGEVQQLVPGAGPWPAVKT